MLTILCSNFVTSVVHRVGVGGRHGSPKSIERAEILSRFSSLRFLFPCFPPSQPRRSTSRSACFVHLALLGVIRISSSKGLNFET